ncbi:MAG: lysophospholipase [Clostridia bacterium]|nr:lysophospholipase [Clostridia bacterium]
MTYGKSYTLKRGSFPSSDGVDNIAYYIFVPKKAPHAIVQISHGMCEHIMRYEDFADFLCSEGFVVCGNEHLGHGNTAPDDSHLGYTAKGGADFILRDLHEMTLLIKREYPSLPLVLLGHSMGSFIARLYLSVYQNEADAAIISGTGGPESPTAMGKLLAKLNILFCGEMNRSELIYNIAFGSYSKRYPKGCSKYLWISRDEEIQSAYAKDKFCTFRFTAGAYYDLFDLLGRVSKKSWAHSLKKELPILMISGNMDPVGNYGKGVMTVYERLKAAEMSDVTLKLYDGGHHEMLNEINRDEVYADILAWLDYHGFAKNTENGEE